MVNALNKDLITGCPDPLFLVNASGVIVAWNPALERATGIPPSSAIGKSRIEAAQLLIQKEHISSEKDGSRPGLECLLENGFGDDGGKPENLIVYPDGKSRIFECSSLSVPQGNETARGGILWDISERKGREDARLAANKKLSLLNSITCHDINNQLTVFTGYLALMEDKRCPVPAAEVVKIFQGANNKIQRIIRFSKEFQEIGAQSPSWQNLGRMINEARSIIVVGGMKTSVDPACDDIAIFADPVLVKVFYNLIDNTLCHDEKATEIRFSCRQEDDNLVITYEDNGVGIAGASRPHLFQRGKGKNSGYGLFLIREILSIHNFTIDEKGESGQGVKFVILIPHGSFRPSEKSVSGKLSSQK